MVCIFFSACMHDMSSDYLAACGSYSIPGMFCYEVKGGSYKCTVLEEDSMGRILYEYTTFNTLTEREETATIICQQYAGRYVSIFMKTDAASLEQPKHRMLRILRKPMIGANLWIMTKCPAESNYHFRWLSFRRHECKLQRQSISLLSGIRHSARSD